MHFVDETSISVFTLLYSLVILLYRYCKYSMVYFVKKLTNHICLQKTIHQKLASIPRYVFEYVLQPTMLANHVHTSVDYISFYCVIIAFLLERYTTISELQGPRD